MGNVERVDFEGHLIFMNATSVGDKPGANDGIYAWELTYSTSRQVGTGTMVSQHNRAGLILPRPGATYSQVKSDIATLMLRRTGGDPGTFLTTFWDFRPNVVFGADNDVTGNPREVTPKNLAKGIEDWQAYEAAEAAKRSS